MSVNTLGLEYGKAEALHLRIEFHIPGTGPILRTRQIGDGKRYGELSLLTRFCLSTRSVLRPVGLLFRKMRQIYRMPLEYHIILTLRKMALR